MGGIERRNVVDVPSDNNASPGPESATTEAGLSPVKGATTHSVIQKLVANVKYYNSAKVLTWVESPLPHPIVVNLSEYLPSSNRLRSKLLAQRRSTTSLQQLIVPFTSQHIHQVHAASIGDFNWRNGTQKYGRNE